jgi:serine/threonine protein kinase
MLTADFLNGASIPFVLTNDAVLGRGATAEVHSVIVGDRRYAIKLYKAEQELNEAKILSMSAFGDPSKPEKYECAWPVAVVKSDSAMSGYLMETFDKLKHYPLNYLFDPTFFNRLNSSDVMSLSNRVEVALSLCSAIAALHSREIYCIDLKPQNILVNWTKNTCVLLDCDGFSFRGSDGSRFPAGHISTDYIAPEATREKLTAVELGASQDKYALAVILFQLFNYAQHPFQGISSGVGMQSATNDEYAAAGLYPYGVTPNRMIAPRRGSTHECLPHELRTLFDRAFIGHPDQRVSPQEWSIFFENIIEKKLLKRCDKHPKALSHVSFQGGHCAECARLTFASEQSRPQATAPFTPPPLIRVPPQVSQPVPPQVTPKGNTLRNVVIYGGLVLAAFYFFGAKDEAGRGSVQSSVSSAPSKTTSKSPLALDASFNLAQVTAKKIIHPKHILKADFSPNSNGETGILTVLLERSSNLRPTSNVSLFVYNKACFPTSFEISAAQTKLQRLGYKIARDGILGSKTSSAIKDFQKKNGLEPTGDLDELTSQKLSVKVAAFDDSNYKRTSLGVVRVWTTGPAIEFQAVPKPPFCYVMNEE